MGLKIEFYASVKNDEQKEIELCSHYKDTEKGHCIYSINASEVCSEFIAKYFYKVKELPQVLLKNFAENNYKNYDYEKIKQELYNGIYKVNLNTMFIDSEDNFKFKTSNACENVREKLINQYSKVESVIKRKVNKPKIEIYALFML